MTADFIQIHVTAAEKSDADRIASLVVEKRLAACAQVSGPITSIYWWKGKIETTQEYRLTLKTRAALFDKVAATVRDAHPYETPEIVATPLTHLSPDYAAWLDSEIAPA